MAKIFYYCGGRTPAPIRLEMRRHVEILNAAGRPAYCVYAKIAPEVRNSPDGRWAVDARDFFCRWDRNDDCIVFGEEMRERLLTLPGRKVLLVQSGRNALAFPASGPLRRYPYDEIAGAMVFTEEDENLLRLAFPGKPVARIESSLASAGPRFIPSDRKRRQVAVISSDPQASHALCHFFHLRAVQGANRAADFRWIVFPDRSVIDPRGMLEESALAIFLRLDEGMRHLPLWSFLAGCVNAGWRPRETQSPPFIYECDEGRICPLAEFVESLLEKGAAGDGAWQRKAEEFRRGLRDRGAAADPAGLLSAWAAIAP